MSDIDILIIGAGPIGLSCGIEAQNANITYKIIEKGCLVNSIHNFPTDMTFFSSSEKLEIGNIPFNTLSRRPNKHETLEYYRRVSQHYDLNIGLYETFQSIKQLNTEKRFEVTTSKEKYTCNFIINATGFYDTPIMMNVPGEELSKVNHYYKSAHHLFRQKVAIIGASNSAVDVALEANRKGADVTLLVRGKSINDTVKYWIKPDLDNRITEGKIKVYYETEVLKFTNDQVLFKQHNKELKIENNFVYAMTGYRPNDKLLKRLGIETNTSNGKPLVNEDTMESKTPNIYLAGALCGGFHTQEWFIENSRNHGNKIIQHIKKSYGNRK